MAIRFTTPYYLAGSQKQRFHSNQAEKGAMTAAGLGAVSYGLRQPKYQDLAIDVAHMKGFHIERQHAKAFSHALGYAAGASAGYATYHAGRATAYSRTYKRKVRNKTQIVKKGRRR